MTDLVVLGDSIAAYVVKSGIGVDHSYRTNFTRWQDLIAGDLADKHGEQRQRRRWVQGTAGVLGSGSYVTEGSGAFTQHDAATQGYTADAWETAGAIANPNGGTVTADERVGYPTADPSNPSTPALNKPHYLLVEVGFNDCHLFGPEENGPNRRTTAEVYADVLTVLGRYQPTHLIFVVPWDASSTFTAPNHTASDFAEYAVAIKDAVAGWQAANQLSKVHLVDLSSVDNTSLTDDGTHPNDDGNTFIYESVKAKLEADFVLNVQPPVFASLSFENLSGNWNGERGIGDTGNWSLQTNGNGTVSRFTLTNTSPHDNPAVRLYWGVNEYCYGQCALPADLSNGLSLRFYQYIPSHTLTYGDYDNLFRLYNAGGTQKFGLAHRRSDADNPPFFPNPYRNMVLAVGSGGNTWGPYLSTEKWYRVEVQWASDGSGMQVQVYGNTTDIDGSVPFATMTLPYSKVGDATQVAGGFFRFGQMSTEAEAAHQFDSFALAEGVVKLGPFDFEPFVDQRLNADCYQSPNDIMRPTVDNVTNRVDLPLFVNQVQVHAPTVDGLHDIPYAQGAFAHERRKLDMDLPETDPPEGGYPTVVWVHGGHFWYGDKSLGASYDAGGGGAIKSMCLSNGWAFVCPNYRLMPQPGLNVHSSVTWADMVKDVKLAVRWIADYSDDYDLNPDRIVVSGHSAGGYLAMMAGTSVGVTGAVDSTFNTGGKTGETEVDLTLTEFGLSDHQPFGVAAWEGLVSISCAVRYEKENLAPLFVIENDARVLIGGYGRDLATQPGTYNYSDATSGSWDRHASLATSGHPDTSPDVYGSAYIQENQPVSVWYCAGASGTVSPVHTASSGSPAVSISGHGYYLKQACAAYGIDYRENFESASDHDSISAVGAADFIQWAESLIYKSYVWPAPWFDNRQATNIYTPELTVSAGSQSLSAPKFDNVSDVYLASAEAEDITVYEQAPHVQNISTVHPASTTGGEWFYDENIPPASPQATPLPGDFGGTSDWRFFVADWDQANPKAMLVESTARKLTLNLDGSSTVSLACPGDGIDASQIAEFTTDLIVSRDTTDVIRARVHAARDLIEQGQHVVQFDAIDYRGLLERRFTTTAYSTTGAPGTGEEQVDIAWHFVNESQQTSGGDLGITKAASWATSGTGVARLDVWPIGTNIAQAVTDMGNAKGTSELLGFDWTVNPDKTMEYFAPVRGEVRNWAVEVGLNCFRASRTITSSEFANAVTLQWTDPAGVEQIVYASASDLATRDEGRWEYWEGGSWATTGEAVSAAEAKLAALSGFTPSYECQMMPGAWSPDVCWLGDTVNLIIRSGRLLVDAVPYRVQSLSIDITDEGEEQVTVTLGTAGFSLSNRLWLMGRDINTIRRR